MRHGAALWRTFLSRTLAAGRPDNRPARQKILPRCGGEDRRAVGTPKQRQWPYWGGSRCGLLRPEPAGQSGEYPEGQAAHRSGQVQRLRIVQRCAPWAVSDPVDVSQVYGICIKCCACVKNHKVYTDPGYLYHQHELEEALFAGSGGNVSVIHCNRAAAAPQGLLLPVYFSPNSMVLA